MYEYKMEFENVTRKHCGSEIKFKAKGLRSWEKSVKMMVKCKCSQTNAYSLQYIRECYAGTGDFLSKILN